MRGADIRIEFNVPDSDFCGARPDLIHQAKNGVGARRFPFPTFATIVVSLRDKMQPLSR